MAKATAVRQRKADHQAFVVLPVLERLQAEAIESLNALDKRLNKPGHQTPQGGAWTATAVKGALARVAV